MPSGGGGGDVSRSTSWSRHGAGDKKTIGQRGVLVRLDVGIAQTVTVGSKCTAHYYRYRFVLYANQVTNVYANGIEKWNKFIVRPHTSSIPFKRYNDCRRETKKFSCDQPYKHQCTILFTLYNSNLRLYCRA